MPIPATAACKRQGGCLSDRNDRGLTSSQRNKIMLLILMMVGGVGLASLVTVHAVQGVPLSLAVLQERQNAAIAKVRFSVVHIKAYNQNGAGPQNIGAGVIVTCNCYVVTNSHVVSGFDTIDVGMLRAGGAQTLRADVIADDPKQDLALLKIRKRGECLQAPLALEDDLAIGEKVFAIGSPFGFSRTVTHGVVSKRRRNVSVDGVSYDDMIQVDAGINQGNSGGPIVNLNGEVIGITSAIFSRTGTSNGIGFGIPISRVRAFMQKQADRTAFGSLVVATEKETINLTEKVPHKFLGNCLDCHKILYKTEVSPTQPVPHPTMGSCTNCHEMVINKPGMAIAVTRSGGFLGREGTAPIRVRAKKSNIETIPNLELIRYIIYLIMIMVAGVAAHRFMKKRVNG